MLLHNLPNALESQLSQKLSTGMIMRFSRFQRSRFGYVMKKCCCHYQIPVYGRSGLEVVCYGQGYTHHLLRMGKDI